MKILSTLFLLFTIQFCAWAQNTEKAVNIGDQLLLGAEQIEFIKQHGLFIRLRTNDMAIEALDKAGRKADSEALVKKQNEIDDRVLKAFKQQFTFTKVYYFYSRDLEEFKKGHFSNLYNLDGTKATYNAKDFFMLDPYVAQIKSMNSNSTGFTLLTSDAKMAEYPMPDVIIRRYGPIYKTYPQLVFDWNYEFYEMDHLGREIKSGELNRVIKSKGANYTRVERRNLLYLRKEHNKAFKKTYAWSTRPKQRNSDE